MDLHSSITLFSAWIEERSNTNPQWFLVATEHDVFLVLPLLPINLHEQVLEKPDGIS